MAYNDVIHIGPTPIGEDCAPAGVNLPDYDRISRAECRAFINQLKRVFGTPPSGVRLRMMENLHDGIEVGQITYYNDVVVAFDSNNEEAMDYALRLEGETPEYWDEEALRELKEAGVSVKDQERYEEMR